MPETPDELAQWAASGAMALTGRTGGPPLVGPGRPVTTLIDHLAAVRSLTRERTGQAPELPGPEILAERAALAGLARQGPRSCGGAFRTVAAKDGWFGLSLARLEDVACVPALVEADVPSDPWQAVMAWARTCTSAEAEQRGRLLGLACAGWPGAPRPPRPGVVRSEGGRQQVRERPLVVDLTSLWAGPLCAHLLSLSGCDVVKVESRSRPDGARRGPSAFFDLLHAGAQSVAVDLDDPNDRDRLRRLVRDADLVLEASRAAALRQHGIVAEEVVEEGTSWVSITAHGRASDAVGFGDDVAMAAGLVVENAGDLLPVADAVADPLSGIAAAAAAAAALTASHASLVDVSMVDVAREARRGPLIPHLTWHEAGTWYVESASGRHRVAPPRARTPAGRAPELS